MCCTRLAENTGRKNYVKNRHYRTILSGCVFATRACRPINSRQKLSNNNLSSTCPRNMVNFSPLMAERGLRLWGTQQISTGFATWVHYCTYITQRRSTNLCRMFGRLLGSTLCVHFRGLLSPGEILPCASKSCVLLYWQRYCTALEQRPSAKLCDVVQGMEWYTRNGITELSQRAPPIFSWAAITFGIGPHSSCYSHCDFAWTFWSFIGLYCVDFYCQNSI